MKSFRLHIFILLFLTIFLSDSLSYAQGKITKSSGMFHTIDLVSPQVVIKDTSYITFRLKAPKAKKVTVDGDFLPKELRPAKMKKNADGIWEYTYKTLESMNSLYSYVFYVDSLRFLDPSNINIIRNDTQYYNYFVVKSKALELYTDKKADSTFAEHGTILHTWYKSDSLKMDRRLTVYLPAGYFTETQKTKVLYLLHGMGGDEDSWLRFGRLQQIIDYLIAEKYIEPLIVVMPNGNVDVDAAPGESAIGYNVPDPYLPHTMDGTFERVFGEIVQFVDSNFKTEATKKGRLIAGYSMGGVNALWIALNNPDLFSSVGLFSPAIGYEDSQSDIYSGFEEKFKVLVQKDFEMFWMKMGKEDFLFKNYKKLNDSLLNIIDRNRSFDYSYGVSEGGHIWLNWRNYLIQFLEDNTKPATIWEEEY